MAEAVAAAVAAAMKKETILEQEGSVPYQVPDPGLGLEAR